MLKLINKFDRTVTGYMKYRQRICWKCGIKVEKPDELHYSFKHHKLFRYEIAHNTCLRELHRGEIWKPEGKNLVEYNEFYNEIYPEDCGVNIDGDNLSEKELEIIDDIKSEGIKVFILMGGFWKYRSIVNDRDINADNCFKFINRHYTWLAGFTDGEAIFISWKVSQKFNKTGIGTFTDILVHEFAHIHSYDLVKNVHGHTKEFCIEYSKLVDKYNLDFKNKEFYVMEGDGIVKTDN